MKITTIKNNDFTVPVIDAVELAKEIKLRKILTDKKVTSTIISHNLFACSWIMQHLHAHVNIFVLVYKFTFKVLMFDWLNLHVFYLFLIFFYFRSFIFLCPGLPTIKKVFYREHPSVANMDEEEVEKFRYCNPMCVLLTYTVHEYEKLYLHYMNMKVLRTKYM